MAAAIASETPYSSASNVADTEDAGFTMFHSTFWGGSRYPHFPGRFGRKAPKPKLLEALNDSDWLLFVGELQDPINTHRFWSFMNIFVIVFFVQTWISVLVRLTSGDDSMRAYDIGLLVFGLIAFPLILYETPKSQRKRAENLAVECERIVLKWRPRYQEQGYDIRYEKSQIPTSSWLCPIAEESNIVFSRGGALVKLDERPATSFT